MALSTSSSDAPQIGHYFAIAGLVLVLSFGAVWAWAATMKLAFIDPEYPAWLAKQTLSRRCDLGEILILGDSRAAVDVIPALLPAKATNLAVGGGEAIEALAALTRALACPDPPTLVILSLDPGHFVRPDLFWERSVRFGFLGSADIAALRDISRAVGDRSVYEIRHTDGTPSWLRDWLYTADFPAWHFADLLKAGGVLRWGRNQRALAAALASRGQYYFGMAEGSDAVAMEGNLTAFHPLPVLAHYFDGILALLAERGVPAVFLPMPVNQATAAATRPAMAEAFRAWLAGYEARYPGFRVVGPVVRPWPNRWFGDGFSHLNPAGATRFSALLGACLNADLLACDLGDGG